MKNYIKTYLLIFSIIILLINWLYHSSKKTNVNFNRKNYYAKDIKIFSIGSQNLTSYVSLIALYFDLPKSKHSIKEYDQWSMNFFKSITSPFILYTDYESLEKLLPNMKALKLNATILVAESYWNFFNQIEVWRKRVYVNNYIKKQILLDPERKIHNPSLYAIWNMKIFLTNQTSLKNPYNSSFFIYTDIGAWRSKVFFDWPSKSFVKNLSDELNDRILFGQVTQELKMHDNWIEGGFFCGSKKAIKLLLDNFYDIHDDYLDRGLFVGKDQNMMFELAFKVFNSSQVARLKTWKNNCSEWYDVWFFYQYFLANEIDYICNEPKFSLVL